MTGLAEAIERGDPEGVVAWLEGAASADRKAARERVYALEDGWHGRPNEGRRVALQLARLALGRWGDVRRAAFWVDPSLAGLVVRALRATSPDWIGKWLAARLEDGVPTPLPYPLVRRLAREGLAGDVADTSPGRLHALAWWLETSPPDAAVSAAGEDPAVLRDLRDLLEVDARALRGSRFDESGLLRAFLALLDAGRLTREEVLTGLLRGLGSGMDPQDAPVLCALHDRLAPSADELAAREGDYLHLLRGTHGPTVALALAASTRLERAGRLDDRAFCDAVRPVFAMRPMNHPKAALAVLERIAARDPDAARGPLLDALGHPAPQVQRRATAILEAGGGSVDRAALAGRVEHVADSVRTRVAALAGDVAAPPVATPSIAAPPPPEELPVGIEPRWVRAVGLDGPPTSFPGQLCFAALDVPRLDRSAPVVPIGSVDELCDELSRMLQHPDAVRFERVLDGASRLGPEVPPARVHPLVVRDLQVFGVLVHETRRIAATLARAPVDGPVASGVLLGRIEEVLKRIRERRPAPRAALPADERGWVDPRSWALRLAAAGAEPDPCDRVAALWRLAPEGRAEALSALPEGCEVERWACGGPAPSDRRHVDALLAAARARDPEGDVSDTVRVDGANGSGVLRSTLGRRRGRWPGDLEHLEVAVSQVGRGLAVVRTATEQGGGEGMAADLHHQALAWPARPHLFLARGVARLDERRDTTANAFEPVHPFVEPLRDPDLLWDDDDLSLPRLVAAVALTHLDPEVRGRAVEAAVAAARDGRWAGGGLGHSLAAVQALGRLKLNRVSTALSEVARGGPLARWVCADAATELLVATGAPTADLHHLLEVLRELLAGAGRALDPRCRPILQPLVGKTKAGRLAQELLATTGRLDPPQEVVALARAGRVDRLRRWAAASASGGGGR